MRARTCVSDLCLPTWRILQFRENTEKLGQQPACQKAAKWALATPVQRGVSISLNFGGSGEFKFPQFRDQTAHVTETITAAAAAPAAAGHEEPTRARMSAREPSAHYPSSAKNTFQHQFQLDRKSMAFVIAPLTMEEEEGSGARIF